MMLTWPFLRNWFAFARVPIFLTILVIYLGALQISRNNFRKKLKIGLGRLLGVSVTDLQALVHGFVGRSWQNCFVIFQKFQYYYQTSSFSMGGHPIDWHHLIWSTGQNRNFFLIFIQFWAFFPFWAWNNVRSNLSIEIIAAIHSIINQL